MLNKKKHKHIKKIKIRVKEILQISCYVIVFTLFIVQKDIETLLLLLTYLDCKFIKK